MYFYLQNGKYYRCRNAGKNKCNKTGKYGMKRMTCGVDSVSRIEAENKELERELQDYINPYATYPSVPRTIPITIANLPTPPSNVPKQVVNLPSVPTHLPSSRNIANTTRKSPPKLTSKQLSKKPMTISSKKILVGEKNKLQSSIDSLTQLNEKYEKKKLEIRETLAQERLKGNITKQSERLMAKHHKMLDNQIKRNVTMITNLQRMIV